MKNYLYTWLDPKLIDEQQALELAQSRAKPRFCLEFVDQLYDPAALIHRLQQFTQTRSKVRSGNHA